MKVSPNDTPKTSAKTTTSTTATAPTTASTRASEISKAEVNDNRESLIYQKDKIASITGSSVDNLNSKELILASKFAEYMEIMAPNVKLSNKEGGIGQLKLYHLLTDLYRYDPSRFKTFYRWAIIAVDINRKKRGAFYDRYVMRFYPYLNISPRELTLYMRLVNLLIITADLKRKQEVVKRVNIRDITETIHDEIAKNNIITYYYYN